MKHSVHRYYSYRPHSISPKMALGIRNDSSRAQEITPFIDTTNK